MRLYCYDGEDGTYETAFAEDREQLRAWLVANGWGDRGDAYFEAWQEMDVEDRMTLANRDGKCVDLSIAEWIEREGRAPGIFTSTEI